MRKTIAWSVVTAVVGFAAVYLIGRAWLGDDTQRAHVGPGGVSADDVVRAPIGHSVVVRGFVFVDSTDRVLVCSARHPGHVPSCAGRAIIATQLDENRLDLVTGTAPSGRPLRWSRDAVGLQGTWNGATLAVTDVIR